MQQAAAPVGPAGRAAAWLGGALFVTSLAYFLYCYGVRFAHGRGGAAGSSADIARAILVNLALFSAFALHHSIMARSGAKRWLTRHVPQALERSTYVWVASVLFLATCFWWQDIPGLVYEVRGPWRVAGWAVQAVGVWLTLDGARAIDLLDLAGVRQTTGRVGSGTLQARGAYGLVRHPIYLGWTLLVFGTPVMTGTRLSFALISTLYLVVAIPFEERSLMESFGDEYVRYQRQVRWRMVPGLY